MRGMPRILANGTDILNCLSGGGTSRDTKKFLGTVSATDGYWSRAQISNLKEFAADVDLLGACVLYNILCEGDSLTASCYYSNKLILDLYLTGTSRLTNIAVGGSQIQTDMIGRGATADGYYSSNYYRNIAIIWGGTNDYYTGGRTAEQIYNDLSTWCQARKSAGWETFVISLHPNSNSGYMSMRAELAEMLDADSSFCDGVIDSGNDPLLADPSDLQYFISDGLHLTQAGGELIAPYIESTI